MNEVRRSTIKTLPKSDFVSQLQKREKALLQEIEKRRKQLKKAPEGSLRITNAGNRVQYFLGREGEKKGEYIKQDDVTKIVALAQKKYDSIFIKEAEIELKTIHRFLKSYAENISGILSVFPKDLKDKINPVDMPDEDYARYWKQVSFEPKALGDDVPLHFTMKGERVRSKSEEMIANALFSKGIPYRYECPVKLKNGVVVHPDFTILDVRTRREIFLEHLGKVDDPGYVNRNMSKFREYERSGINLGKNLLVTYESTKEPLNTRIVEEFIKTHFGK